MPLTVVDGAIAGAIVLGVGACVLSVACGLAAVGVAGIGSIPVIVGGAPLPEEPPPAAYSAASSAASPPQPEPEATAAAVIRLLTPPRCTDRFVARNGKLMRIMFGNTVIYTLTKTQVDSFVS